MKKVIKLVVCMLLLTQLTACGSKEFSVGAWNGTNYECNYANLSFKNVPGWQLLTDQQAADLAGESVTNISGVKDGSLSPDEVEMAYMFAVQRADSTAYVIACFDNMNGKTAKFVSGVVDEATYVEAVKTQMQKQFGDSCQFAENSKATLGGQEFNVAECTVTQNGITVKQRYYIKKYDRRMLIIGCTYLDSAAADIDTFVNGVSAFAE